MADQITEKDLKRLIDSLNPYIRKKELILDKHSGRKHLRLVNIGKTTGTTLISGSSKEIWNYLKGMEKGFELISK